MLRILTQAKISFSFNYSFFRFITMYPNETTNKFSREIALEHVLLQLNTNDDKGHYFEIRTDQNIYYCGCKRIRNRVRISK
jgi:hypothetical protein